MRLLVISDIHANFSALEAVLEDSAGKWDRILCLGDTVGYGPSPNECVQTLSSLPVTAVPGNHDWAALGLLSLEYFNQYARAAAEWTRAKLSSDSYEYLSSLEPVSVYDEITLFHGSPVEPITDYILSTLDAAEAFELINTSLGLFGHSHVAASFCRGSSGEVLELPQKRKIRMELSRNRYLLNPGSVGQPRTGDPRASYAVLDTEKQLWLSRKVSYNIKAVQQRIRRYGLPEYLAQRLGKGR